jgi:hypothetical protein
MESGTTHVTVIIPRLSSPAQHLKMPLRSNCRNQPTACAADILSHCSHADRAQHLQPQRVLAQHLHAAIWRLSEPHEVASPLQLHSSAGRLGPNTASAPNPIHINIQTKHSNDAAMLLTAPGERYRHWAPQHQCKFRQGAKTDQTLTL